MTVIGPFFTLNELQLTPLILIVVVHTSQKDKLHHLNKVNDKIDHRTFLRFKVQKVVY